MILTYGARLADAETLENIFAMGEDDGLLYSQIVVFQGGYTWKQR